MAQAFARASPRINDWVRRPRGSSADCGNPPCSGLEDGITNGPSFARVLPRPIYRGFRHGGFALRESDARDTYGVVGVIYPPAPVGQFSYFEIGQRAIYVLTKTAITASVVKMACAKVGPLIS
jgi:hypothetical protein